MGGWGGEGVGSSLILSLGTMYEVCVCVCVGGGGDIPVPGLQHHLHTA